VTAEYGYYPFSGHLFLIKSGAWTKVAITDPQLGTLRGWVNANGADSVRLFADSAKGVWGATDTSVVRFRFAGAEYDQETGLYYMRARYYDPQLGRFLGEDPLGVAGGVNLYAYAGNDPVNMSDPSGMAGQCFDRHRTYWARDYRGDPAGNEWVEVDYTDTVCFWGHLADGRQIPDGGDEGFSAWARHDLMLAGSDHGAAGGKKEPGCGKEVALAVLNTALAVAPVLLTGGAALLAEGGFAAATSAGALARSFVAYGMMSRAKLFAAAAMVSLHEGNTIVQSGAKLAAAAKGVTYGVNLAQGVAIPAGSWTQLAWTAVGVLFQPISAGVSIYDAVQCMQGR